MSKDAQVTLYRGENRREIVRTALDPVMNEIDWSTRTSVVVKPNLVVYDAPYAVTHRDTLETVLAVIRDRYAGPLTIAEGCAIQSTAAGFAYHNYYDLAQRYNCTLVDLNADEVSEIPLYGPHDSPLHLRVAKSALESDCRISLSVPKTHDAVLMTGTVKNMIMASLVNRRVTRRPGRPHWQEWMGRMIRGHGNGWGSDKLAMHKSYPLINLNLARLAPFLWPHVALLDGFVAMEGDGPIEGDPVDWRVAFSGTDALAVDALAAYLMGLNLTEIGYLYYCSQLGLGVGDIDSIRIEGNAPPSKVARRFRLHSGHVKQRQWRYSGALDRLTEQTVHP